MNHEDLGHEAEDVITGFRGRVTGFVYYLTGCNQVLLVSRVKDDGTVKSEWFDTSRIVVQPGQAIKLPNQDAPNGPDREAPKR